MKKCITFHVTSVTGNEILGSLAKLKHSHKCLVSATITLEPNILMELLTLPELAAKPVHEAL